MNPLAEFLTDAARCLRFYSRLALPRLPWEGDPHAVPDFTRAPRALPLAGAVIGGLGGAVLWAGLGLGLGPAVSAVLAVAALVLATGALHEDGLADLADGLGGATPERRLEIMRDSRIGSFGASALILSLALRIGVLATLSGRLDPAAAAAAVVFAAAQSRSAALLVLAHGPPARRDGAAFQVGKPSPATLLTALLVSSGIGLALVWAAALPGRGVLLGVGLSSLAAAQVARASRRWLGGQTGDTVGAAQQLAEIVCLLALLNGAGAGRYQV